jgi:hypothetical protein
MKTETNKSTTTAPKVEFSGFELTKERNGYVARKANMCAIYLPTTADDVQKALRQLEQLLKF